MSVRAMGASPGATANERFTESTLMSPALEREPLQRGQLSDEEAIRLPTGFPQHPVRVSDGVNCWTQLALNTYICRGAG